MALDLADFIDILSVALFVVIVLGVVTYFRGGE